MTITDKQVKKTESSSLPKIIAKCGYNRNISLDIWGGTKELGSAAFYCFKNTIGAARVQYFFKTGEHQQKISVRHYVLQCHGLNIVLEFHTLYYWKQHRIYCMWKVEWY